MKQINKVSFCQEVKSEICTNKYSDKELKEIILIAFKSNSTINIYQNEISLFITSFIPSTIKFFYQGIKKFYPNKMEIKTINRSLFGEMTREYKLEIFSAGNIYEDVKNQAFKSVFCSSISLFLLCGNITSPDSPNYNLYLTLTSEDIANDFLKLTEKKEEFNFKLYIQNNKYVLNLKRGEEISNFLKYIYCFNAVFKYEDARIKRDHLNTLNRLSNLDISNQAKAIEANKKHIILIKKIYENPHLLSNFKIEEKQIMEIKMLNDDLTSKEISEKYYQIYGNIINKTKINNLMEKIKKFV